MDHLFLKDIIRDKGEKTCIRMIGTKNQTKRNVSDHAEMVDCCDLVHCESL